MKELVKKIQKKQVAKKKIDQRLTQKERFIEYAREIEVDETGKRFERTLKALLTK